MRGECLDMFKNIYLSKHQTLIPDDEHPHLHPREPAPQQRDVLHVARQGEDHQPRPHRGDRLHHHQHPLHGHRVHETGHHLRLMVGCWASNNTSLSPFVYPICNHKLFDI